MLTCQIRLTLRRTVIRRRIRELGLTQEMLAYRLGVSAAAVSRWLNGQRQPAEWMVNRIASHLDISPKDITR